ncbi:MAG TPA: hypothetical protein VHT71_08945 [Methylomirabilota bacterium]|nr:hypothetical protein [Methylomirabilota bacterium]
MRVTISASTLLAILTLAVYIASAEPVAVRYPESISQGVVVMRAPNGSVIATGELVQALIGEHVQSQLVFRFKDGSLYDETVTFSQNKVFRLLTYKLAQKGPSFPEAMEVWIDRASGHYRARVGDDTAEGALDLPEDLHNGMAGTLLRNLPVGGSATGHMYAFTPKARLMRTMLRPEGEDRYFAGETAHTSNRYIVTMDLVGMIGLVATVLGKDPPDVRFWISTGPAPSFLKFEGPMFVKGPRWRIELSAPRWPER